MTFNSPEFLLFFPIVVVLYYSVTYQYRIGLLLLSSYVFYMAHNPVMVVLLVLSTLVDYFCANWMYATPSVARRKLLLFSSIGINLGLLFAFKYWYFFFDNFRRVVEILGIVIEASPKGAYNIDNLLLPVGISFYTFQTMSYTIEVYRGKLIPEQRLDRFALYVAFFPQLVAGPIEKATRFLPQLRRMVSLDLTQVKKGILLMVWGFFLKVVVADRLGVYVDEVFLKTDSYQGLPLLLGSLFFGFQIYYDFSAYSTIAVGAAMILGYNLVQNFNRPFFSTSSTKFWQKWHISLMQWMRDYLYKPLKQSGMNRLFAVFVVFVAIGFWHGANWTFVVWSILNVGFLIAEVATQKVRKRLFASLGMPRKLINFLGWAMVIGYLFMTLIIFRASSLGHALLYFRNMIRLPNLHIDILNNSFELLLSAFLIAVVQVIHYYKGNNKVYELVWFRPAIVRWGIYMVLVFVFVLFGINRQDSFIYFQF
jgi:D-alanyl-lipoteichoic acid acyltransferase DltB (MBOAT superfamily)